MWWSKALLLLAVLALGPVGCGFRPLYARGGDDGGGLGAGVESELARIRIQPIKDRLGQQMRNALIQRLTPRGEPGDYDYTLTITLNEAFADMGYRKDTLATLGKMTVSASISLVGNGVGILSDSASTITSFDYVGPRYASVAMERDAEERAIVQLADDIRSRVAVAVSRYKASPNDARYRPLQDPFSGIVPIDAAPRAGAARPADRP